MTVSDSSGMTVKFVGSSVIQKQYFDIILNVDLHFLKAQKMLIRAKSSSCISASCCSGVPTYTAFLHTSAGIELHNILFISNIVL